MTKEAWENNQLEIKLDIASAAVTEDKDFICVVSTPGQIDQKTTGKLKTYGNCMMNQAIALKLTINDYLLSCFCFFFFFCFDQVLIPCPQRLRQ